jgi:hypothetical protein
MPKFEMPKTDVVVSFIYLGGSWELLDDIAHDAEALSVVTRFVEAGSNI